MKKYKTERFFIENEHLKNYGKIRAKIYIGRSLKICYEEDNKSSLKDMKMKKYHRISWRNYCISWRNYFYI